MRRTSGKRWTGAGSLASAAAFAALVVSACSGSSGGGATQGDGGGGGMQGASGAGGASGAAAGPGSAAGGVSGFASKCAGASPPQIPMVTYYQILQASGVAEGSAEVTMAATNQTFMSRYYADWRFLLQKIGPSVAILHVEPDFWGYAEQYAT